MKPRKTPQRNPSTARRARFRIDRLEERIAPRKGGKGTHRWCASPTDTPCGGESIY